MFKNHLKIALRQLARNKVFSGINILGLSLGMTLAILIAVFIKSEFSYDSWIPDKDHTFRVYRLWAGIHKTTWTPPPLAKKLKNDYPEVVAASGYAPMGEQLIKHGDKNLYVELTAAVDSSFFDVMQMSFLHGDRATALDEPNSVVITDALAERLFGTMNPIGQVLTYGENDNYIIRGVLDKKDKKTHIEAEIFTRFTEDGDYWTGNNRSTYVRLNPNANKTGLEKKIKTDVNKLIEEEYLASNYTPTAEDLPGWGLQVLPKIYLQSDDYGFLGYSSGSMKNLYIFALIALLVLTVAIINYINLTTARASQRSKEVGVKKVAGAGRGLLTTQFITESVLQACVAGLIALILAELCLPFFNTVTDRELAVLTGDTFWIIAGTLSLGVLTGLLAGVYPAFVMSAYRPVIALKSNFLKTGDKGLFRKVLVTGQFVASITLLIVMTFIYRQVNHMMDQDLGFKPEQVMTIPMNSQDSHRKVERMKARFKNIPGVQEVTTASHFPKGFLPDWGVLIDGQSEGVNPNVIFADSDFAKSLDIEMLEGRFIDERIGADSVNNFVVNEEFLKRYNIEAAIGTKMKFTFDSTYGQIVGVMKNFHFQSLDYSIRPLVINARHWRNSAGIKLNTTDLPATIKAIESVWKDIEPNHPMRTSFLDEEFAEQYGESQRFGKTILYATVLTLFIALLGLFGLTAFNVERRTREIGIRKVLGASVTGIVGLLAQDFMKLVTLACLIAIPLGFLLSDTWLKDFPDRTEMAWWIFAGAGLAIIFVGFLTVCLQSIRAALTNPIDSLRSE
jgi:putative ABC transport system permease protein